MSTDFTIEFRDEYISVRHAEGFEITPKSTKKFWLTLADECKTHKCLRVLTEGTPGERKMSWLEAHNSAILAAKLVPGIRLACRFENYVENELTSFFKIVASKRNVYIEFFSDRNEALRWLGVEEANDNSLAPKKARTFLSKSGCQILITKIFIKILSRFRKKSR